MWFWFSLIALFCWSGSDVFSKVGSKADDKNSHFKMVMAIGLVMGLHAMYEIFVNGVDISWSVIWTYLPASILYILAMVLGYIGLRYIELSVSSPICNGSGAVASIFLLLFFGEKMQGMQAVSVIVVCAGVLLLGIVEYTESDESRIERQKDSNRKYVRSLVAILLPVCYCLIDAAGTVADYLILDSLNEDSANVAYELTFLVMGVLSFIYVVLIKKEKLTVKREGPKLLAGICETAGQFAYIYAIASNAVVAAPIISSYCVLSVVWSRLFLKEKLTYKHYIAIFITVVGIALLGIYGE